MCKADSLPNGNASAAAKSNSSNRNSLLLFSVDSFSDTLPSKTSQIVTSTIIIAILVGMELVLRFFFHAIKDYNPIFEEEVNRNILARHVGVDAFSCFVVAILGYQSRHVVQDMIDATVGRIRGAMPVGGYEARMFTYHPEAQRITLFFVAYQLKNTYDTIMWNDGIIFIIHHVLTLLTTWGALQGMAHGYVIFYFGVSEISTGVLCLLANFDDDHGVVGLADAFPMTKVVIGAVFAVLFVICRVVMWSTVSYYYCRDAWNVLTKLPSDDPRLQGYHKTWFQFTFGSLSVLSLLQIIWLAEIGRVGYEELHKIGLF